MQKLTEREGRFAADMPAHAEPETPGIDRSRECCPVPAHKMLVVWRENAFVEDIERRLKPGWPRALQDHLAFFGIGGRQSALAGSALGVQIDRFRQHR